MNFTITLGYLHIRPTQHTYTKKRTQI